MVVDDSSASDCVGDGSDGGGEHIDRERERRQGSIFISIEETRPDLLHHDLISGVCSPPTDSSSPHTETLTGRCSSGTEV